MTWGEKSIKYTERNKNLQYKSESIDATTIVSNHNTKKKKIKGCFLFLLIQHQFTNNHLFIGTFAVKNCAAFFLRHCPTRTSIHICERKKKNILTLKKKSTPSQMTSLQPQRCIVAEGGRSFEAVAVKNKLRIFDTSVSGPLQLIEMVELRGHLSYMPCLDFSCDNTRLVSACCKGSMQISCVATGETIGLPIHGLGFALCSVKCSPDGKFIAVGDAGIIHVAPERVNQTPTCSVWNATTQKLVKRLKYQDSVRCVAWSPDSKLFAMATLCSIFLFSTWNWEKITTLAGHTGRIDEIAFFLDSKTLCSAGLDRTLRFWCTQSFAEKSTHIRIHTAVVYCLAVSNGGALVALGGDSVGVEVWNEVSHEKQFPCLKGHSLVKGVVFSRDDKILISCGSEGSIRFWDADNGTALGKIDAAHSDWLSSIAISPNGKIVAAGFYSGLIKLWHFVQSKQIAEIKCGYRPTTLKWEYDGLHVDDDETPIYQRAWHLRQFVVHIRLLSTGKIRDAFSIWNVTVLVALFIPPTMENFTGLEAGAEEIEADDDWSCSD